MQLTHLTTVVFVKLFENSIDILVGFYGISTIIGYLMLNPIFTCILNMILKTLFSRADMSK